jgi:hypothetical protein
MKKEVLGVMLGRTMLGMVFKAHWRSVAAGICNVVHTPAFVSVGGLPKFICAPSSSIQKYHFSMLLTQWICREILGHP